MAMLPPPPLDKPTAKEKQAEQQLSKNLRIGEAMARERKSMPKQPLVAPSKTQKWNQSVANNALTAQDSALYISTLENVRNKTAGIHKQLEMDFKRTNAPFMDELKAAFMVAENNNDFTALRDTMKQVELSKNKDKSWMDTVSDANNVEALMTTYNIPSSYATTISETSNQEQFFHLVNQYKLDKQKEEYINSSIGTVGQTVGAIGGALTGFDVVAGIAMPYTFISKANRIKNSISSSADAERALSQIASIKKVATVSGLGYSAVVPFIKNEIHKDYTFTDGLIDAIAFGAIDTGLIVRRGISSVAGEAEHARTMYKAKAAIDATSPIASKSDDSIGGIDTNFKAVDDTQFDSLLAKQDSLTKQYDSLTKRAANTRLGKVSKAKAEQELAAVSDELSKLNTEIVGIKKTKNIAKKTEKISLALEKFGVATKAEVDGASTMIKAVDDSVSELSQSFSKELDSVEKEVLKAEKGKTFALKTDKDGNVEIGVKAKDGTFKSLSKKQKLGVALAIGVMAQGTAFAEDGEGSIVSDIPQYVAGAFLAYIGGTKAMEAIYKHKGLSNAVKATANKISATMARSELSKDETFSRADKVYNWFARSQEAMGFHFKTAIANSDEAGKQLAKDLFWDFDNTYMSSAEHIKSISHEKNLGDFYRSYNEAWAKFSKESGKEAKGIVNKLVTHSQKKKEFNEAITMALEFPDGAYSPIIKKLASDIRPIYDRIIESANKSGVKGFRTTDEFGEIANKADNYVTRVIKSDQVYRQIKLADGEFSPNGLAYQAYRRNIAKMYSAGNPDKKAGQVDEFVDEYMLGIQEANNKNIRGTVGDILGDRTARSKARVNMDMSQWEDFDVTVNGITKKITLDQMYERDIEALFSGYSNAMEGHIALAKKNYKSYTDALNIAGQQSGDAKRSLTTGINMIIGRPTFDTESGLYQFLKGASNLASPMFMSLSAIMQIKEAGSTAIRAMKNFDTFSSAVRELKNSFMARGTDDAYTQWIMDMQGNGQRMVSSKLHTRIFNDIENLSDDGIESAMHQFNKYSQKARDFAMLVYGIAPLTDWGQRMNGIMNMDLLAKVVNGKKTLTRTELESYGITDDVMAKLKPYMRLNEKNNFSHSARVEIDSNDEIREEVSRIVFNMNQTQMLQPTIGSTPMMFHDSALGSVFSTLMNFAMNAYNIYGGMAVKGIARGEATALFDSALWLGTMYAAEMIKSEIKGKQESEEEMLVKAMMNMPLSAPFGWVGSLEQPLVSSSVETIAGSSYVSTQTVVDLISGME